MVRTRYNLIPENYDYIRSAMLVSNPDLPSALDDMSDRALCSEYPDRALPLSRYDTSFTRQAWETFGAPSNRPDVVIGTAYSGIPPLDAVRGFYEEIGVEQPIFLPLRVNQRLALEYCLSNASGIMARLKTQYWANGLRPLLSGAKVVIIEEYVSTGACMELSGQITKEADASSILGLRGRWYSDAHRTDVDIRRLTSRHAPFMRHVGHMAARSEGLQSLPAITASSFFMH